MDERWMDVCMDGCMYHSATTRTPSVVRIFLLRRRFARENDATRAPTTFYSILKRILRGPRIFSRDEKIAEDEASLIVGGGVSSNRSNPYLSTRATYLHHLLLTYLPSQLSSNMSTETGTNGGLTTDAVKVTYDAVPGVEAAAGGDETKTEEEEEEERNPWQLLQQHSERFNEQHVQPLLAKSAQMWQQASQASSAQGAALQQATAQWWDEAGSNFNKARQASWRKSQEIADATVAKTKEFTAATAAKSREIGDFTVTKSREIGEATLSTTRSISVGTQVAAAATLAQTQHTLAQIGSNPLEYDDEGAAVVVKGAQNDHLVTGWNAYLIQGTAVVGGGAALVAMILMASQLIDIASFCTIVLAPLVVWQKMKLETLGGMVRACVRACVHTWIGAWLVMVTICNSPPFFNINSVANKMPCAPRSIVSRSKMTS